MLRKETDKLKLSIEASQEIMEKKVEQKANSLKLKHGKDINTL